MSYWEKQIYPKLPVFAQNWAISAYGLYWHRRRFGGIYEQELRGFKERENFTDQHWRDYQTVQLRKLLVHAFETVPLYRERYSALGFTKSQLERFELEDLFRLPCLTKDDLRQFGTTTLLSSQREKGGQLFSSSGSTGTPVQILYSHAFHQRMNAAMEARVRNWAGVSMKDARGMIGGRRILPHAGSSPPFYRYNIFERQVYFSAYHISHNNSANYLEGIRKYKLGYMTGYAMSNYFLASFFNDLSLDVPQLKAVITSSEKLTDPMREVLNKVYGCRTFDSYSGVENCGLISESPEGELLISPDVGIMEILNEQGTPVESGGEGEIVSTGFLNRDQPLIRYRIGDRARQGVKLTSSCGRQMPKVEELSGRVEDTIVTKDGRQMVRFHGIFIDLSHVLEAQVVQHNLDDFTVRVVTKKGYGSEDEALIIKRMQSQLGTQVNITIQEALSIPRTANGKFKAVVSEMTT